MCHKEMLGWHSFSQLLSDTTATSLSHNASDTAQVCVCCDTACCLLSFCSFCHTYVSVFQGTSGSSSLKLDAVHISRYRLVRHLAIVISNAITSMISTGELCPQLNELGFKVEKVATAVLIF